MARDNSKKMHGPGSGPIGINTTERAKDFKGSLKKLFQSMSKYRLGLIIAFICAIASTIFSIIGPKI